MSESEPLLPWTQFVRFVSQFNHDLRNHLNAIELQAAFVNEIAEGEEMKSEVARMREMTAAMGAELQRLSGQLSKIQLTPMAYRGSELVEDLRAQVQNKHGEKAAQIEWQIDLDEPSLETDPHMVLEAFSELIENALTHNPAGEPIRFHARAEGDTLVFTLREPKAGPVEVPANWGAAPLAQVRHGHYALGLFRARSIFEAHHGTLQAHFDPAASALLTTVTLPRARS